MREEREKASLFPCLILADSVSANVTQLMARNNDEHLGFKSCYRKTMLKEHAQKLQQQLESARFTVACATLILPTCAFSLNQTVSLWNKKYGNILCSAYGKEG